MGRLHPTPAGRKFRRFFLCLTTKPLFAEIVVKNSFFPPMNKNFMQKKDSLMSLVVAHPVEQLGSNKLVETVADMVDNNVRCSRLFVRIVEKKPQFLSNHPVINPFIAATVINPANVTIGKPFKNLPLLGRVFFIG
jgi:hypothetical protein